MKYLITRNTVYDVAGVAMIQGAMIGMKQVDEKAEFAALVLRENNCTKPVCRTYVDPEERTQAFLWADVVLDIGGLCQGKDPYRFDYIHRCRKLGKPYIYMSQSFRNPHPAIVKGIPAIARGPYSAQQYLHAARVEPPIAADLSFLIDAKKPKGLTEEKYKTAFTTHLGKPWERMNGYLRKGDSIQVVWKPQKGEKVFEPFLPIEKFHGKPAEIFGLIEMVDEVHTARYHTGVAAIRAEKPLHIYVLPEMQPKYDDLLTFQGMSIENLKKSAMVSCEMVRDIVKGKVIWK